MKNLATNANGNAITSFAKELNLMGVGEYMYIVDLPLNQKSSIYTVASKTKGQIFKT